jgi:chromatin structure-remodeling complex subunit RSC9
MVAKDFITNVTSVFPKAQARVVATQHDKNQMRYTMKGISARAVPIDLRGRAYVPCMWKIPVRQTTEPTEEGDENVLRPPQNLSDQCDCWFSPSNVEEMWTHVVDEHLGVRHDANNAQRFSNVREEDRLFACLWAGCSLYPAPGINDARRVCTHIKVHLPDHGPGALARAKYVGERDRSASPPRRGDRVHLNTPVDEQGRPLGLPLQGALVLRNLARQMLKLDEGVRAAAAEAAATGAAAEARPGGDGGLVARHFGAHREKLCYVTSNNQSLRALMPELMEWATRGVRREFGLPRLVGLSGD